MVELTSAALYYYTWGRISSELHLKVGCLPAAASFCTLVISTESLVSCSSPATPGSQLRERNEASRFWEAFFNPTCWPSLFL